MTEREELADYARRLTNSRIDFCGTLAILITIMAWLVGSHL